MKKSKKILIKLLCLTLVLCMAVPLFTACSGGTIMELGEKKIETNVYEFLLSRMKGSFYTMGYDVNSESFWNMVFSINGMTYGEYFKTEVLKQTYTYLVTDFLFDKEGLTLPDESVTAIETLMDKLVERAGSKNKLNSELASFGVNYNMLKEIYTTEAKMLCLKEYYFGKDAEKISKEDKDKYYNENYVSFKQVLLAGYFYACETEDGNLDGTPIYYTNDKAEEIAYDKEKGSTKRDVCGEIIIDKFGNPVYYLEDGSVAYDKVNGTLKYLLDEKGNKVPCAYGKEKLGELKEEADSLASLKLDTVGFDKLIEEFSDSDGTNEVMYLLNSSSYYSTQNANAKYLDDIAAALGDMKVGESRVVSSDYGYHIIYKYQNGEEAYNDEKYADVFESFNDDIIEQKFSELCDDYESRVELDEDVWKKAPTFTDVGTNLLY